MAKEKRLKKKLKRQFSAGGAVFRREDGEISWLLVKPAGTKTWRLPKGIIDRGETSREAAQREVQEETGAKTKVLGKVGNDKYFFRLGKDNIYKIVVYYLMEYEQEAKGPISWEVEEIAWLPYGEAREKLAFKGERGILEQAKRLLEEGTQGSLI